MRPDLFFLLRLSIGTLKKQTQEPRARLFLVRLGGVKSLSLNETTRSRYMTPKLKVKCEIYKRP